MDSSTVIRECDVQLNKQSLFLELVYEVCQKNNSRISASLKSKIRKLLADVDLSLHMSLHRLNESDHRSCNILGLSNIKLEELTFNEQKILQTELDREIMENYPNVLQKYGSLSDGYLSKRYGDHIHNKEKDKRKAAGQLCKQHAESLRETVELGVQECEMLKEWTDIRLVSAVSSAEQEVNLMDCKQKILELKGKIIKLKVLPTFFRQDCKPAISYAEVHKDMIKQIDHLHAEVSKLKKKISQVHQ